MLDSGIPGQLCLPSIPFFQGQVVAQARVLDSARLLGSLSCLSCNSELPRGRFLTCRCHLVASYGLAEQTPTVLDGVGIRQHIHNQEAGGHDMASL